MPPSSCECMRPSYPGAAGSKRVAGWRSTISRRRASASSSATIASRPGRDDARHESTAGLAAFLEAAKYLVRPSGRICFIYHPLRLPELFAEAARLKLAPLRLRMVHGSETAEARMFLMEMAKGRRGELQVLPPLFVNGGGPSGDPRGDADDGSERNFREMRGNHNAKR